MDAPTNMEVRAALGGLDEQQQKIVIGLLSVMINDPQRVRETEWMAQRLTELTLLAAEFQADTPEQGVQAVEAYLQANSPYLLRAAMLLFQRVGLDLAPQAKTGGFSFEDAVKRGLSYMPQAPTPGHDAMNTSDNDRTSRDLGEQPLAHLMAKHGLKPKDLVAASTEQLTFRMVTRAMKGRRLTANTMGKVQRAWSHAAPEADQELFNYRA